MKDVEFLKQNEIDVNHGLELLGDMEMYDETLQDFITESETRLPNLKQYFEAVDMENYAILVHSMKSDSKYLGFTTLAELSFQHEMASKEQNISYVKENYETLVNEANRIINIVKQYLKEA